MSSDDLIDVVRTLVPSFNVSRQPISDGSSFVRPPQMRGLDSDKTLVLVNGKRRHRAALVVLGGFGSHGPDLATIPSIALKSVEVLRDGAAAQYGSDAIAGVMNFNLKDAAEGGEARIQVARYTEDDNARSTWVPSISDLAATTASLIRASKSQTASPPVGGHSMTAPSARQV